MDRLIFELVGPNYGLARAEIRALLERSDIEYNVVSEPAGLYLLDISSEPSEIGDNLGLVHRILHHIHTSTKNSIGPGEMDQIRLPEGSAAVDARRILGKKGDTERIKNCIGEYIPSKNSIDLDDPDHQISALFSDKLFVGRVLYRANKDDFKDREVKNRPFFYPISLGPRYARALVNLARPREGDTVCDPFCGTGGLLLEAASMGLDIRGGDISEEMVNGCKKNLSSFGMNGSISKGDFEETIGDKVDCIVTDPPYGRASSSSGEGLEKLYKRFFSTAERSLRSDGHLAIIFPESEHIEFGSEYLTLVENYVTRVHSSLERHYCVFRKI